MLGFFCLFFQVGGTYARPMLLPPEVAIGAFGRVQVRGGGICVCVLCVCVYVLCMYMHAYVLQEIINFTFATLWHITVS